MREERRNVEMMMRRDRGTGREGRKMGGRGARGTRVGIRCIIRTSALCTMYVCTYVRMYDAIFTNLTITLKN